MKAAEWAVMSLWCRVTDVEWISPPDAFRGSWQMWCTLIRDVFSKDSFWQSWFNFHISQCCQWDCSVVSDCRWQRLLGEKWVTSEWESICKANDFSAKIITPILYHRPLTPSLTLYHSPHNALQHPTPPLPHPPTYPPTPYHRPTHSAPAHTSNTPTTPPSIPYPVPYPSHSPKYIYIALSKAFDVLQLVLSQSVIFC